MSFVVKIKYNGQLYSFQAHPEMLVQELLEKLSKEIDLPDLNIKLVYKGILSKQNTLESSHINSQSVIIAMATSSSSIEKVSTHIPAPLLKPAKARIDDPPVHTFSRVHALPGFADVSAAHALLVKVSKDYGVAYIMRKYQWKVDVLKELHPAEKEILGFNRNKGQEIAIRIRTDALDGFRHYNTIRKVVLHELTHMVHSDHDENFHALNRQLNKECDAIMRSRTLSDNRFYQPKETLDVEDILGGGSYVLGGSNASDIPNRIVLADAADSRLSQQEEQEQDEECDETKRRRQKYHVRI